MFGRDWGCENCENMILKCCIPTTGKIHRFVVICEIGIEPTTRNTGSVYTKLEPRCGLDATQKHRSSQPETWHKSASLEFIILPHVFYRTHKLMIQCTFGARTIYAKRYGITLSRFEVM